MSWKITTVIVQTSQSTGEVVSTHSVDTPLPDAMTVGKMGDLMQSLQMGIQMMLTFRGPKDEKE